MPKRRKVANMLALAVLSAVSTKPMHPYEMASVLRSWGKDQDMKIKWGSLYTVVQNLEKHGFVEATGSVRQGGRPERTVYRITDAGRAEMLDWVRELIGTPYKEYPAFEAALSVAGVLPPDDLIELLRERLEQLDSQIEERRELLAASAVEVPRIFLIESEYDIAIRAAEADWVRSLLDELTVGTLPGMDMWRAFHETGELPPDIKAMAERGTPTD